MLDEDLTPVFASEPINLWLKIMRMEFSMLRSAGIDAFCRASTHELGNTISERIFSSCTRMDGHKGPHVNIYGAWER